MYTHTYADIPPAQFCSKHEYNLDNKMVLRKFKQQKAIGKLV